MLNWLTDWIPSKNPQFSNCNFNQINGRAPGDGYLKTATSLASGDSMDNYFEFAGLKFDVTSVYVVCQIAVDRIKEKFAGFGQAAVAPEFDGNKWPEARNKLIQGKQTGLG